MLVPFASREHGCIRESFDYVPVVGGNCICLGKNISGGNNNKTNHGK
jgi:hypothetical protein